MGCVHESFDRIGGEVFQENLIAVCSTVFRRGLGIRKLAGNLKSGIEHHKS